MMKETMFCLQTRKEVPKKLSMQPCKNMSHPSHGFEQQGKSDRYLRLERKMKLCVERKCPRIYSSNLYLRKSMKAIYYTMKKHLALTECYGDIIWFVAEKLEKPITMKYLQTCLWKATYISAVPLLCCFLRQNIQKLSSKFHLCHFMQMRLKI